MSDDNFRLKAEVTPSRRDEATGDRDCDFRLQPEGLCNRCTHARLITSSKGSEFVMCQLSATDDRFPKYPALPVLRCEGYSRILFPDR